MSQSLLNLKLFRYQKPSHIGSENGSQESRSNGGGRTSPVLGRRRISSAHSEPDSPVVKQKSTLDRSFSARRRLLSDSDDDGASATVANGNDDGDASDQQEVDRDDPSHPDTIERSIAFMQEAFPNHDPMDLQDCLARHDWRVETAMEVIAAQVATKRVFKPPQKRRRLMIVDSDTSEDDNHAQNGSVAESFGPQLKIAFKKDSSVRPKNKSKKAKKAKAEEVLVDSGDDEDFEDKCLVYLSDSGDDEEEGRPSLNSARLWADRRLVVEYLNTAAADELVCMEGCSKKKAELIAQRRPFSDWNSLVSVLSSVKTLSPSLLNSAMRVIRMRSLLDRLLQRCEAIAGKLKARVTELVHGGGEGDKLTEQPSSLNSKLQLSPYQLIGLSWLILMFKERLNAVLADEMGLGKTIQAISFLAYLQLQDSSWKYLIVVPSSTLDNWVRELALWCPSLSVLEYRGSIESRRETRLQVNNGDVSFDVCVTTYTTVASTAEDKVFFKTNSFKYIVFDEAHMLKNMTSKRYQNLRKLKGEHRLLLTGTPLQNNLVELMSLLVFVMPEMFSRVRDSLQTLFEIMPNNSSQEGQRPEYEASRVDQAKRIMAPFFLRRLKRDVLKDLPTKSETIVRVAMVPEQAERYRQLKQRYAAEANNKLRGTSTTVDKAQESATGMLMSMRKLANHPLLMRHHYTDDKLREIARIFAALPDHEHKEEALVFEDLTYLSDFEVHQTCHLYKRLRRFQLPDSLVTQSGKMAELDRLLPQLQTSGCRVLLFSQFVIMLDVLEAYVKLRGYRYCRLDGSTAVADRIDLIDRYNSNEGIFLFLLSTRAGGLGINLTSANVVILHDIDFNPHNDRQAEDRCHRIGQTREVRVMKLICQNSIDECMLRVGQNKLNLDRDISATNEEGGASDETADVGRLLELALDAGDG